MKLPTLIIKTNNKQVRIFFLKNDTIAQMNLTDIYEIFYSNTIKYTLLSGLMGISLKDIIYYDMSKSHQIRRTEVTPHILYEYKPIPMVTEEKKVKSKYSQN